MTAEPAEPEEPDEELDEAVVDVLEAVHEAICSAGPGEAQSSSGTVAELSEILGRAGTLATRTASLRVAGDREAELRGDVGDPL